VKRLLTLFFRSVECSQLDWFASSSETSSSVTNCERADLVRRQRADVSLHSNSLYYSITTLGLLVCTYNHSWSPDVVSVCSTNSTWATPVLASLPAAWRLGQSIRRYIDSDGLTIHMLNAGKYSASILQFFFYYSWSVHATLVRAFH